MKIFLGGKSGRSKMLFSAVLFLAFGAIGCSSVPLKIPTPVPNQTYKELGQGTGNSTGIMLFNLIPIGQNARFEKAYTDAVKSKNGDALINPVIEERWFWAYVLNGYSTTVSGTVIKYDK